MALTVAALAGGAVQPAGAQSAEAPTASATRAQEALAGVPIGITGTGARLSNKGNHLYSANGICFVGHRYVVSTANAGEAERVRRALARANGARGARLDFLSTGTRMEFRIYHQLRESYWGIPKGNCIASGVAPHKGRDLRQLPGWAKGVLAALAATAVFVAISIGAGAVVAYFGGGVVAIQAAEIVGGCIGGAMSNYAYNLVMGVSDKGAVIASALTNCISGALVAFGVSTAKTKVIDWIRGTAAGAAANAGAGIPMNALNTAAAQTAAAVAVVR
ncbi:hypothetical protein [Lentzea sp. HUAS12]|uniref:hypothetical protein n=1 Tax=Lentzea sp. HUAS12 TaxID=2951806 RepID=UPI0020A1E830|nr:hypothetical protein [Lentzea sp. HUAS12]USX56269.1 hypothetical protein ND450_19850 [Lentzea sp. HUAS12]